MNTRKLILAVFLISILLKGCIKENPSLESYSSYISVQINAGTNLGFDSDSIIQIYLRNNSDKEFAKECSISYLAKNLTSGTNYTSETSFFNIQYPNVPNGQLKLLKRDSQFFNINLTELDWNNKTISYLPSGQYSINVQLFIKDPYSPMNIVNSNNLIIYIK